jgi:hypothetical protein
MVNVCALAKSDAGTLKTCTVEAVPVSIRLFDDSCSVPFDGVENQPLLMVPISELMS